MEPSLMAIAGIMTGVTVACTLLDATWYHHERGEPHKRNLEMPGKEEKRKVIWRGNA